MDKTLDEILGDYGRHIRAQSKTTTYIGLSEHDSKQAILQWVADEVVGEDYKVSDAFNREEKRDIAYRNDTLSSQRQILIQAGWKPEGEK